MALKHGGSYPFFPKNHVNASVREGSVGLTEYSSAKARLGL